MFNVYMLKTIKEHLSKHYTHTHTHIYHIHMLSDKPMKNTQNY